MLRTLSWACVVLGSALGGAALFLAVLELSRIYAEAADDPMGLHSPEPQSRAWTVLIYAALGLPGVLLSAAGFVGLLLAKVRRKAMQSPGNFPR